MKISYRQRLTGWFCLLFALFTVGIIVIEQSRERQYKTEALEEKLDAYADIAIEYIRQQPVEPFSFDALMAVLPDRIRLTWIDRQGNVLYDNVISDPSSLQNHADRPEIKAAAESGKGTDIRISASNKHEYLYYAKQSGNAYIRVALPYDIEVRDFLKPDNAALYYILLLFVIGLVVINLVAGRFGKSIRQLRDFSVAAGNEQATLSPTNFPDDELGEIGVNIVRDYEQLRDSRNKIALEREKLLQHVHSSSEGICFFTADYRVAYYNGLFIQFLNVLVDQVTVEPAVLLEDELFKEVHRFLDEKDRKKTYFETMIHRQGKHFAVRVNRFDDQSFEVILNDQTKQEKNRQLKQEMTGNIAHELRTPVASIRGYLETILDKPMDAEKEKHFLNKAYNQVITLSELIQDMSLLTKIDETPEAFQFEPVTVDSLLHKIHTNMGPAMKAKGISIRNDVPADTAILGNENLLYAVFRNLTENVIRHAGENVQITIRQYNREGRFAYFSFADNGVGIKDEQHLRRLFERFYRISEGRSRETGGTGLGLSIVKNVITFHGGTITVKNRAEGGLEFLFSLPVSNG